MAEGSAQPVTFHSDRKNLPRFILEQNPPHLYLSWGNQANYTGIMNLTIIGSGYVGLTTGTCFAEMGHHVICVDNNEEKIRTLQSGAIPIYEPKLEDLVKKNVAVGRLEFSPSIADSIAESEVIFIAVPTPPNTDGSVDLTYIEKVAREIAQVLKPEMGYKVIVDKSTVPVKTGEKVTETIKRYAGPDVQFDIVSNPEFLREGCAVDDLLQPDRIVIGANSERAMTVIKRVYQPIHAPILETDVSSAELIKHAANSFLALKISYINAVAKVCEKTGADVKLVAEGIGMDKRISRHFLNAGLGYGGSCFPKDVKAFINISRTLGTPFTLLEEVERINDTQHVHFLDQIRERLWVLKDKKIAVWGLAFKQNTDDIRESVAIRLCQKLRREGAAVTATDPKAMNTARPILEPLGVTLVEDMYECARDAEVLIIATEWSEYANADLQQLAGVMRNRIIFDGRNILSPANIRAVGFEYHSVGRPSIGNA